MQNLVLRRIIVAFVGTVLILGLGYWMKNVLGSREQPKRQMSFRESAKQVEVEPVVLKSREIYLSNMGKVISESAVDLIAEVQGEIRGGRIPLKRGQSFAANQVLFRIDDEEARLSLYAQKSNFMTAVAGILPELKIDYPGIYGTWQGYFESLSVEKTLPALPSIENSQEKVFFSTRDILNQFYSIKSAEERLDKYIIRAPFSGSYIEVLQESGSVVNTGTRIARIARSNRLEVELPVRPEDLSFIRKGMTVEVMGPEESGQKWPGRINRVSSIVDPTTQSVNVYIQFNPKGEQVFDGQLLLVRIPGSRIKDVMEIPRNAVFNKNQVYVVEDNHLKVKEIQIEKLNREDLLFTGLDEGTQIVIEPLVNAYENMEVITSGLEAGTSEGIPVRQEEKATEPKPKPKNEDSEKEKSASPPTVSSAP